LRKPEQRARIEAEAARSHLSFLSEASRTLGSSLDYETTLKNLAHLIVPDLGDCCVVDLAEEHRRLRRVAIADIDPEREALIRRLTPSGADEPGIRSRVFSTGESEWLPEVTDEMCLPLPEGVGRDVVGSLKFRSFISVPLPVHGQNVGVISIARSKRGRSYTSADLALAEELARRAALAVDHARLYRVSQEANRVKDEFLATLSHELRSPLSSALLCAQMLRRGVLDREKTAHALETIERKIDLEVRLVDDLIDIARINTGRISLEMKRVQLAEVVDAAVEGARAAAEARGTRLRFTPHEIDASVYGDEARLQQVMDNLLANAIKFTPKGGSVDVALERIGSEGRITVRDTGIGITAAALPEVFDRFRQVDTSSTRRYGGLGLGLAIVKNLVEIHKGEVIAESAGGGLGSTFTVTLPLLPASTDMDSSPSIIARDGSVDLTDLHGVRVLVVDDDEDACEAIATSLRSRGAEVTMALSARRALDLLRSAKRYDVLVSDIGMPDIDGYALLCAIRARHLGDATVLPAIAVTAYAGPADRERILAAGYRSYLAKPVDDRALASAVAEVVGKGRAAPRRARAQAK
jgi:signal transduction histidine kinase/ActR/RegA family two-component response regulator